MFGCVSQLGLKDEVQIDVMVHMMGGGVGHFMFCA